MRVSLAPASQSICDPPIPALHIRMKSCFGGGGRTTKKSRGWADHSAVLRDSRRIAPSLPWAKKGTGSYTLVIPMPTVVNYPLVLSIV